MVPPSSSARLQTVQCPGDTDGLAHPVLAKLKSCSEPAFLLGWGIEVGVLHVSSEHLQSIQGCDGKRKSYAIARYDTGENIILRGVGQMAFRCSVLLISNTMWHLISV